MAVTTNDLRNGMTLDLPDGLFAVVEFQHVKPGKGGAFVRTKLKNVRTGAVLERTFRADERVEQAIVDKREMQLLYRDGTDYVFMDVVSYDQLHVSPGRARRRRAVREGGRQRRPADVRGGDRRAWTCPPRSSCRWPRPSPVSRATGCRGPASRPRSRPGSWCRSRCS